MANPVGIAREQQVFAVKETTKGTLVFPAAADLIVAAGFVSPNQQPSFTDSPEIINSRDLIDQFQDKTPAGEWSLPIIARPSGSLGVKPNAAIFYESLLGLETVNSGVSVVYSPAMAKPSFSLWVKKSHTVFFCTGATVGKAAVKTVTTGGVTFDMSGKFMQMGWAGTDALNGAAADAATEITVDNAKKFTEGARVEFVEGTTAYNNSGAGYEITDVNTTTNVVTVGTALEEALDDNSVIRGYLPTGSQTSTPLENRKSRAVIDAVVIPIKSMDISITDDPQYLDDEITEDEYPEEYVEVQRVVDGALEVYFRQDDLDYFHDGRESNEKAVTMRCGNVAGVIMEVAAPRTKLSVPAVQEADPTIALNMPIKALGTVGEDSVSITFR